MKNREIKFRAWNHKAKQMYYDVCIDKYGHANDGTSYITYNREKDAVMQYTGLKDSKGKEIYEGDILRQKKNKGAKFKVYFDKDGKWMADEIGESFGGLNHELWSWAQVTEVIGTIHENSELLK